MDLCTLLYPTTSSGVDVNEKKNSIKKEFPTLPIQGINNHPFIIFQIKAWKTLKKKQNKKHELKIQKVKK